MRSIKMIHRFTILLTLTLSLFWLQPAFAETTWGVGGKLGTLGIGLEGTASINKYFKVRLNYNTFGFDTDQKESDIDYEFDLDWDNFGVIANYHPFEGMFFIAAGIYNNGNEISAKAKLASEYKIGDKTYTNTEVTSLRGSMDFDSTAPYIGLGWSKTPETIGFAFNFELGVLFSGEPRVKFTATGTSVDTDEFKSDLKKEEQNVQNDLNEFDLYPVLTIGIGYYF
ncbi:hypothetical protein [Algicola sagamiensis]|uniref:hypothetical protein n=1 Tax=Algicola sagamiensis TaxID=163869 RepID=UPI0003777BA8|nr:hypothetical protein [Algicola sagamiensis]